MQNPSLNEGVMSGKNLLKLCHRLLRLGESDFRFLFAVASVILQGDCGEVAGGHPA